MTNLPSDRFQILPFYIVCDTSTSMKGEPIRVVNDELPQIHKTIATDPLINDKCQLSVLSFNTTTQVDLPLQRLTEVKEMPKLLAGGRTNYGVFFRKFREIIKNDLAQIRNKGNAPLRPVVFFISDGGATDSWIKIFEEFSDRKLNPEAPVLVSFGVGKAKESSIIKIGIHRAMMAKNVESVPAALREVIKSLTNSIVNSSREFTPKIILPEPDSILKILR